MSSSEGNSRLPLKVLSRRPSSWAILVGLLAGLAMMWVWIVRVDREPRYSGRSVTEWASGLNSADPATRSNAATALHALGAEAIPALVRGLRDRDSRLEKSLAEEAPRLSLRFRRWFWNTFKPFKPAEGRLAAVRGLALFGTNAPVAPLARALHDPERQVAAEAAAALGAIGAPAVPPLIRASADADDYVRSMACYALSLMRPPPAEAVPALMARLGDAQRNIREQAAYALSRQGRAAVPALRSRSEDPDPLVRSNASAVLQRIESVPGPVTKP